ncbi:MAG: SDR family NAD(P)-dependent oxidoreductase [Dehalococcoidia bacterium]
MAGQFDGKVAIITGGNSGIGEGTARAFAKEGAKVALLARREAEGQAVQQAIARAGAEAIFISCDVSDSQAVNTAVEQTVAAFGRIDIVMNNAGGGSGERFPDETDEGWNRVLAVNLSGAFYMTRAAWPHLIAAGGGSIINISSLAAVMGFTDRFIEATEGRWPSSSYFAAKGGLDAFTRYTAGMGARHNIRVNGVRPGQILTPLVNVDGQHRLKGFCDFVQMLEGAGYPEDIAGAVLYLASDAARFVTGEFINVDGGLVTKI